jgi:hypothetical protein
LSTLSQRGSWFACTKRHSPSASGDSREFQTGDAYRPLDDILLHLDSHDGERRCALSIRSNRQITASGVPAHFVTAVWRLALEPGETGFRLEHDPAGLMTAPLAVGVADAMHALLREERAHLRGESEGRLCAANSGRGLPGSKALQTAQCPFNRSSTVSRLF